MNRSWGFPAMENNNSITDALNDQVVPSGFTGQYSSATAQRNIVQALNTSVDASSAFLTCTTKPIGDNPKFSEFLSEDLRTRLLLIKQALQRSASETEHMRIQMAFTTKQLKIFNTLVEVCQSLPLEQIQKILMDRLQEGKETEICETVEKYAEYFIAEFTHFLKLHGFLKKGNSGAPNAPNNANRKVIQQNNFFSIQAPPTTNVTGN